MIKMNIKTAINLKAVFLLTGSILLLQSCATTPATKLAAVASREQKTADDGTITSRKKHLVSLSPNAELGGGVSFFDLSNYKTLFMLSVENRGKGPISIGFDNITVIFAGNGKDPAPKKMGIQSFDDFMTDYETLYNLKEKAFIYNTIYKYYVLLNMKPPAITPEQLTDRMYDFKKDIMAGRTKKSAIQGMLPEYTLKQKTIIEPGNSYSGIVICDTHDLDPEIEGSFHIIVSVDGEEYNFIFRRGMTK